MHILISPLTLGHQHPPAALPVPPVSLVPSLAAMARSFVSPEIPGKDVRGSLVSCAGGQEGTRWLRRLQQRGRGRGSGEGKRKVVNRHVAGSGIHGERVLHAGSSWCPPPTAGRGAGGGAVIVFRATSMNRKSKQKKKAFFKFFFSFSTGSSKTTPTPAASKGLITAVWGRAQTAHVSICPGLGKA